MDKKELTKEILTNSKWRVTPEQSRRLQEKAFELGFKWLSSSNLGIYVKCVDSKCLYFKSKYIFCDNGNYFYSDDFPTERKFEDYFEPINNDIMAKTAVLMANGINPSEDNSSKAILISTKGTFMWAVKQELENDVRRKSKPNDLLGENKFGALDLECQEGAMNHRGLSREDINAAGWGVCEENVFGDFDVSFDGKIRFIGDNNQEDLVTSYLVNLEKAIKRARQLL